MADHEREPHPQTTEARRAAARAASRRWRERNGKSHAPRRRQLDRERYAANRESVLSAKRERYAGDPAFAERTRASNNAWYQRNREKRREYHQRYRQEYGDELRARARARNRQKYASNPRAVLDYYKQWRARNLERARACVRVSKHKRRAAAAGTHFTLEEWIELLAEHEGHCAYCGSTERIEADHRIPLYRGGSNKIGNILPACRHCNRRKHRRTEEEFRALLQAERAAGLLGSR
jgi:5-methylcytosine-specific restriction endonuclease McrA